MADVAVATAPLSGLSATTPPDHRRNSISTPVVVVIPINLTALHPHSPSNSISATTTSCSSASTSSSSAIDFDFISVKPVSYTSLRDLLPSALLNSPKPNSPAGSDISIKNRLVKQAAWAYLQPMSISPDSSPRNFLHRVWNHLPLRLLRSPIAALRRFFHLHVFGRINRAFDWLLRAVRVRSFS